MVIRNRCSSVVEGSPSMCNLCRTSGRQRRACPRIGQASASRPIVGPTSRPLKIKSDRVRKKKRGNGASSLVFVCSFEFAGNSRETTKRKCGATFLSNAQICCSSLLLKQKKTNSKKERKIDDERRDDEDNDRRSLKSLCIFVCR